MLHRRRTGVFLIGVSVVAGCGDPSAVSVTTAPTRVAAPDSSMRARAAAGPMHTAECTLVTVPEVARLLATSVRGRGLAADLPGAAHLQTCVFTVRADQPGAGPALVCTLRHLPMGAAARMLAGVTSGSSRLQQVERFSPGLSLPGLGFTHLQSGRFVGEIDFVRGDDFVSVDVPGRASADQARAITEQATRLVLAHL